MAITWKPYFLTLLLLCMALSSFIYLITWRIARRWGWRGLAVVVVIAAIIGPPRSYWYMARSRSGALYAPGIAPVLAISATCILMIVLGHGVMRSYPVRPIRTHERSVHGSLNPPTRFS